MNMKIFDYYWDWLQHNSPLKLVKLQNKLLDKGLSPIFVKYWREISHKHITKNLSTKNIKYSPPLEYRLDKEVN